MKRYIFLVVIVSLFFSGYAYGSSDMKKVSEFVTERDSDLKFLVPDKLGEPMGGELLTMERAVELALQNNAALKASFEELGITGAEAAKAGLPPNPVLSGSVRYPKHEENATTELSIEANFLGVILTPLRQSLAGAELRKAEYRASQEVLNLAFNVKSAYRLYQASKQVYLMHSDVLKAAKAAMDLSGRQKEAGNLNQLDAANHRAAYAEAKILLSESQAQMDAAKEELNKLMGFGGGDFDWEIGEELPDVALSEPELTKLQAFAKKNRLDLLAAQKEIEVRRKSLTLSGFGILEDATIGVETEKESEGERLTGPNFSVSLPVSDFGQIAIQSAAAKVRQGEYQLAALENEIRSEVKLAYDRLLIARKKVESYRDELLPARTQVIDQTQKHYNFMLLGVYALLEAKHNQIIAYREYIGSLRDYWIARSDLEKAIGAKLSYEKPTSKKINESERISSEHNHGDLKRAA